MNWTWLWWATPIALAVAYGMGLLGARAFRRDSGPDRRVGDRRVRNRRAPGGTFNGVERRKDDRRQGDRRHRSSRWPSVTVIAAAVILAGVAIVAYVITPVPEGAADEAGLGQALGCGSPVTWSVDTSGLTSQQATAAVRQLTDDFAAWGEETGLDFAFRGELPADVDPATGQVTTATPPTNRHVFVRVLAADAAAELPEGTVGTVTTQRIETSTAGVIQLSDAYLERVSRDRERALHLSEVAQALGLQEEGAPVHRVIGEVVNLGPAEVDLISRLDDVCRR